MQGEGHESNGHDTGGRKLTAVVFFAVLGVMGFFALIVAMLFPERVHAVSPIFFLMSGMYLALAVEVHEGALKFFPRRRNKDRG